MAKTKSKELNVDFIGGQEPLTQEEQLAISTYFKNHKKKKTIAKSLGRENLKSDLAPKLIIALGITAPTSNWLFRCSLNCGAQLNSVIYLK